MPADATTLCTLIRELNSLPGDFWIRLLYTHPAHWTDELIQTIAECKKVPRYVDMPLQHIHENMLERMRRETSQQYIVDLIAKIRAGIPGIAIRTTFIVGFPGETEESFNTLLEFIRETKFERLGIFTYSKEEGTRAGKMESQVPDSVKKKRHKLAMAEQLKVARAISESFVGREIKVLIEKEASCERIAKRERQFVGTWIDSQRRQTHGATQRELSRGPRRSRRAGHRWPSFCARQTTDWRIRPSENHRPHRLRFDCRGTLTELTEWTELPRNFCVRRIL